MGRAVVFSCIAALVVFAVVQDRVMVAGVAEYVSAYRAADLTKSAPLPTIDDVMTPAVRRSVQQGAMWGGAVLVAGLGGTLVARKRSRRA